MHQLYRLMLLAAALLVCAPMAHAEEPIQAPSLTEGQFVYTIPGGYEAPMGLNTAGLEAINQKAAGLNYGFFTVVVEDIGCPAGDSDEIYAQQDAMIGDVSDSIARQWVQSGSVYNAQSSQLLVIVMDANCRSPDLNVGIQPRNELGLMGDALDPYLEIFYQQVQYDPKDARAGAINLMVALDEHIHTKLVVEPEAAAADAAAATAAAAARAKTITTLLIVVVILIILGSIIGFFVWRNRRYNRWKGAWEEVQAQWGELLTRYSGLYVDHFREESRKIRRLSKQGGTTGALYKEVTTTANQMQALVEGMKQRLGQVGLGVRTATKGNIQPFIDALDALEASFVVNADAVADGETLFGPIVEPITCDPKTLESDLDSKRTEMRPKWQLLIEATRVLDKDAVTEFPHAGYDGLEAIAIESDIPLVWLAEHPLSGDDASDAAFWAEINALRTTDSAEFVQRIKAAEALESKIADELDRVRRAKQRVDSVRYTDAPDPGDIVLSPSDDPGVTFTKAQRADELFVQVLNAGEDLEGLDLQAGETAELYNKARRQATEARRAKDATDRNVTTAQASEAMAVREQGSARDTVARAKQVHANVNADGDLSAGDGYLASGREILGRVDGLYRTKRYLDAQRTSARANYQFTEAKREYGEAVAHCRGLDAQKAKYEGLLRTLPGECAEIQARITGYRSTETISFNPPRRLSGPQNYGQLISSLESQRTEWNRVAKRAHRAYEAYKRRLRQAREAFDTELAALTTLTTSRDAPSQTMMYAQVALIASVASKRSSEEPSVIEAATASILASRQILAPIVAQRRVARLEAERRERERLAAIAAAKERARQERLAAERAASAALAEAAAAERRRQQAARPTPSPRPSRPSRPSAPSRPSRAGQTGRRAGGGGRAGKTGRRF